MKKRVLSLLLAVVMLWSLLPTAVLAAGGDLVGAVHRSERCILQRYL